MSTYIHGTDPEEQARLSELNRLLNARCLKAVRVPAKARILDVGSGLGQFTMAMAKKAGVSGFCLGVERDSNQLQTALDNLKTEAVKNVSFRRGLAEDLPLSNSEKGSFDLAHTRFLLEHVQDPQQVVDQMYTALRPRGRCVLIDDDHSLLRLYPECPGFESIWEAYMKSYEVMGTDPIVGRKLTALLHHSGFTEMRIDFIHFGCSQGDPDFSRYSVNLIHILREALPVIESHKIMPIPAFQQAMIELERWQHHPDAVIWYVANYAEGIKPTT